MPDVGKDGKRKGDLHPRDARRIDTAPLRATPAAKPHRKAPKLFGYAYEEQWPVYRNGRYAWNWRPTVRWFATERQRDQAFAAAVHKSQNSTFERCFEKVRRESRDAVGADHE